MAKRTDVEWNQNIVKYDNQQNDRKVVVNESDEIEIKIIWVYDSDIDDNTEFLKRVLEFSAYHYVMDLEEKETIETKLEPKECNESISNGFSHEIISLCYSISNLTFSGNLLSK